MNNNNKTNYTVEKNDHSCKSLEELYTLSKKNARYEVKVAAFALLLYMIPVNPTPYNTQLKDVDFDNMPHIEDLQNGNSVQVIFEQEAYSLTVKDVLPEWRLQDMYNKLYDSFCDNFDEDMASRDYFFPVFKKMADQLRRLQINDAFVDVGKKKKIIDFNLYLNDDIFLSVAKNLDENTENEVMFTIARKHRTLVIDTMSLEELIDKVRQIESEMKTV